MAITVRRKIDSCLLILIEESYINKESEKQLRSRYDQFISSVEGSFVHSIQTKGRFIEKSNCLTKPSAFPSFFQIFPSSFLQINFTVYINII